MLDCAGHRLTGGDRTGQYGIYIRDGAGAVVRNCVAERFEVGIRVRGIQGAVLKQNVAQDNLRYGIEVTQGSTAIRIKKNQVLDNGDEGIHLSGPDDIDAAHEILNNTVGGNTLEGIYVLRSHGNLIAGNTVRDHGAAGIYVKDSDRNRLDANTLINDPIHLVYGSAQNVLTDNTIVGQQIRFKDASDNQVHRMTVRTEGGRPSVAYELTSSARNVIADSQVTAPSGYDIRATASSTGNVFPRFSVTSSPRLLRRRELERARQQRQRRRPGLREVGAPRPSLRAPPARRRARPGRVGYPRGGCPSPARASGRFGR